MQKKRAGGARPSGRTVSDTKMNAVRSSHDLSSSWGLGPMTCMRSRFSCRWSRLSCWAFTVLLWPEKGMSDDG